MENSTKIKIRSLLDELINKETSIERKRAIITDLRSLNTDFDQVMSNIGFDEISEPE